MRIIQRIIKEICQNQGYNYDEFANGWIIQIHNKKKAQYIYGYDFSCNNAANVKICKDKAATSAILNYNNLKCFYHQYFDRNNTITQIINYSKKYKNGVVIKPNEGSSGHQVYLCKNSNTMKAAISEILKTNYSLAISPYVSYENEYRAIILNNKILLFYQKIRRFVIGDGVSSIAQLYDKKYHEKICNKKILKKGIKYICNWKHNLAYGATINENNISIIKTRALKIVNQVLKNIDLTFFSIDFALIKNELYIVEINSGIMFEKYANFSKNNYIKATQIYKKAIIESFKHE